MNSVFILPQPPPVEDVAAGSVRNFNSSEEMSCTETACTRIHHACVHNAFFVEPIHPTLFAEERETSTYEGHWVALSGAAHVQKVIDLCDQRCEGENNVKSKQVMKLCWSPWSSFDVSNSFFLVRIAT